MESDRYIKSFPKTNITIEKIRSVKKLPSDTHISIKSEWNGNKRFVRTSLEWSDKLTGKLGNSNC